MNTTGNPPAATNMFEVLQPSTTDNTVGIYVNHSGATAGSSYALQAIKNGASLNNIAGYFNATGGTNNYAGIFENGNVGIGTTSPSAKLHIKGSADATQMIVQANAAQANTNPLIKLQNSAGTDLMWISSDNANNTFVGLNTGRVNNAGGGGTYNTFVGSSAGYSNTTGGSNIAIGAQALYNNTSGFLNIAIGDGALYFNNTGNFNTAIGVQAFRNNNGNSNIALGFYVGDNITSCANNIVIGYDIDAPVATGNNQLSIGNLIYGTGLNGTGTTVSTGNVGISTTTPTEKLHVVGNGLFTGTVTASCGVLSCSDLRYKKDIAKLDGSLNKIKQLNGYTYHWKTKEFPELNFNENEQIGFIAQELELVFPQIVHTGERGFKTVDYAKITPVLVEAIKEQQKIIEALKLENGNLKSEVGNLKQENESFNKRLNKVEGLINVKVEK